jgi:pantothenate kinase
MNAEKYNLDRIYFGGCFIRGQPCVVTDVVSTCLHCCHHQGHASTIGTLSYAIRFWSKGTKRALFLRHEGFLLVSVLSLLRASMFGLIVDWRIQRFHRGMDQAGGICASQLMKSSAKAVFFLDGRRLFDLG